MDYTNLLTTNTRTVKLIIMPTIATQTEPMWDVIDKLNMEFDDLHVKYNKLEKEYLKPHKKEHMEGMEDVFIEMADEILDNNLEIKKGNCDIVIGFKELDDIVIEFPIVGRISHRW